MPKKKLLTEKDLAALAKQCRLKAGKNRVEAARELGVSHTTIFNAEENMEQSLLQMRVKMIEAYSEYRVVGAVFYLERK